jgi:hypothetical protein
MTAKAIPRHARASGRQRRVSWPRAGRLPPVRARGIPRPGLPDGRMPADPLTGPVAITQRAVLGDQIKRPTAWCEMTACISRCDDLAALGEADIRARALAAGWRHDAVGRLMCPYCQRRRLGSGAAYPVAVQHNAPARGPGQRTGHLRAGRISAVWQRCPRGTDTCRVARPATTLACLFAALVVAAAAGTPRYPALRWARLAACTAPGRPVPAVWRAPARCHSSRPGRRG